MLNSNWERAADINYLQCLLDKLAKSPVSETGVSRFEAWVGSMADKKYSKTSSYALEGKSRDDASKDLEKLGVAKGKGWDKVQGQNGRRRSGSILRQN